MTKLHSGCSQVTEYASGKKKDQLEMMGYVRPLMTFGEWNLDIGAIIDDVSKDKNGGAMRPHERPRPQSDHHLPIHGWCFFPLKCLMGVSVA